MRNLYLMRKSFPQKKLNKKPQNPKKSNINVVYISDIYLCNSKYIYF